MTLQDPAAHDLMRRRASSVAAVSALTARALKLTQAMAGVEMDMLRLELAIARDPGNAQLVQELQGVEAEAATLRQAQADCDGEIAAAEDDVATLDRLIAAAKGG
jgi:hypothetical protein